MINLTGCSTHNSVTAQYPHVDQVRESCPCLMSRSLVCWVSPATCSRLCSASSRSLIMCVHSIYLPSDLTPDSSYQNIQQLNPLNKYFYKPQSFLIWCWQVREVRKSNAWHGRTPSQPLRDCLQYSVQCVQCVQWTRNWVGRSTGPDNHPHTRSQSSVQCWHYCVVMRCDVTHCTLTWHTNQIKMKSRTRWSFKNTKLIFFDIPK